MLNSPSKVAIKRLKRKRKLAKRVKCHGNNMSERFMHPVKIRIVPPPLVIKRQGWWKRLLRWLKII
jgi:hypothetical protein